MPVIQQIRKDRRIPSSCWLSAFAADRYSQAGEDGIIQQIFKIVEPRHRVSCEFGAWDGTHLSNTANLVRHEGWKGVFIEGNPKRFKDLQAAYPPSDGSAVLINAFIELAGDSSLDRLLERQGVPVDFDFLSIDIDGLDYHVWESLQLYRPTVVCIEFNPVVPNDVIFIQDPDPLVNQGSSLLAMIALARQKGYELIAVTRLNAFFVVNHLYARFRIDNNDIESLFVPTMDGRVFHGYDSTVYTVGMPRMFWAEHFLQPDSLQLLPAEQRIFEDSQSSYRSSS
jgi:hypothetical protein